MAVGGQRAPERREQVTEHLAVDPSPLKLRHSLELADAALASVEPAVARRVRLLLTEVIGRSSDPRRQPRGLIRIDITVLATAVRIEVAGSALLTPSELGQPDPARHLALPGWVLDDVADRWGLDRRSEDPAMWFLIDRG